MRRASVSKTLGRINSPFSFGNCHGIKRTYTLDVGQHGATSCSKGRTSVIYTFEDYTLNAQQYELRRAGTLVPIRLKALEVLLYLVRHRDRVVGKEELLDHIWDGRIIGPSTLDSCLMEVRQAVGDDGRAQRVIRTLRGRGYRFMPVVEVQYPTSVLAPGPVASRPASYLDTPATNGPVASLPVSPDTSLRALPPGLSQTLAGEHKTVTVLVCHVAEAFSCDDNNPERTHRLRHAVLMAAVDEVQRYGGTVQRIEDEALLALFGAPQTLEDHALRALQAAQGLHQRLPRDVGAVDDLSHVALPARTGLHTGPVIIGPLANDAHLTITSVNDTLPLARGLVSHAQPGHILISDTTLRKVQDMVQVEAVGSLQHHGQAPPILVYRLLDAGTSHEPLLTPRGRFRSRFVGRKQELAILEACLAQAVQGQGQVVGIVGEPGMGKTRLLAECRRRLDTERVRVVEGRCLSYGRAVPYVPLRALVRQLCGLGGIEDAEAAAARVRAALQNLGIPADDAPFLLHVLDVPADTERLAVLTPEALRTRTFALLRELCLRIGQQRPLVLAVENLHWIDASSEAFLVSLVEILAGAPILLSTTFRPGYQPPWMAKSYATQMALPSLSPEESLRIVRAIVPQAHPDVPLVQQILTQAEGNPFFLEELAHSVQEQNPSRASAAVPETIQEVLMARIDRLPAVTKRVLQTASVIGREFSYHVLAAVWETPEELQPHLQDLQRLELLYARRNRDESSYVFKHMLTRDVVYGSMLHVQRQALHQAVGEALEGLYADRLEEVYDLLAHHYARTDDHARAVQYLIAVADKAARVYAHAEALAALHEALQHAERLSAAQRDRCTVDVIVRQSESLASLGRLQESCDLLRQQRARVERLGDSKLAGAYYQRLGYVYHNLGKRASAVQSAKRALAIAARYDDAITMSRAYYVLAREATCAGDYWQAIRFGQQAASLLDHIAERRWLGMAYVAQGSAYAYLGEFDRALEAATQARNIGEAIEDRRLRSRAAHLVGRGHARRGEWPAAIAAHHEALACSPDPSLKGTILDALGDAYLGQGDVDQAIPLLEQAMQRLERFGHRPTQVSAMVHLSEAYLSRGDLDQARALATQGLALAREMSYQNGTGLVLRALGRIAQADGDLQAAERYFSEALEIFTSGQALHQVGHLHVLLARLCHRQGKQETAVTHLQDALALFEQMRLPYYVQQTRQLAGELGVKLAAD
jgi:DNA-binding winged helix-turn-helix (wHTH) protein/tetratricopeptide (TPR) repeat protein/class 3 adenylate cyclase